MDTAVARVQAYPHVNGYFTVVEFPVLDALRAAPAWTVTDFDILASRFPRAQTDVIRRHGPSGSSRRRSFRTQPWGVRLSIRT